MFLNNLDLFLEIHQFSYSILPFLLIVVWLLLIVCWQNWLCSTHSVNSSTILGYFIIGQFHFEWKSEMIIVTHYFYLKLQITYLTTLSYQAYSNFTPFMVCWYYLFYSLVFKLLYKKYQNHLSWVFYSVLGTIQIIW